MQRISKLFTAVKSLGAFGIILLLSVAIIVWSRLSVYALGVPLTEVYGQAYKQGLLTDAQSYLLEQRVNESSLVACRGECDEEREELILSRYQQASDEFTKTLAELSKKWEHAISPKDAAVIDALEIAQREYRQTFDEITNAAKAGDWSKVEDLQEISAREIAAMDKQFNALILEAEIAIMRAIEKSIEGVQRAILAAAISLMLLPILAVWAFVIASRLTQPILTLANAVVAIAGNQFRSEHLRGVSDRNDDLGRLSQTLERLAETIKNREQALGQEMRELREQLYEARRRKRLPTSPGRRTPES
jgi:nitrogen fixation/metabolism regulation signal transduction histidine kinase